MGKMIVRLHTKLIHTQNEFHFDKNSLTFINFLVENLCKHCTKNEVIHIKDFFSKCDRILSFLWIW